MWRGVAWRGVGRWLHAGAVPHRVSEEWLLIDLVGQLAIVQPVVAAAVVAQDDDDAPRNLGLLSRL
jgi:hypothetical protein